MTQADDNINLVTIWDIDHNGVSTLLEQLAGQGLVANRDFEFGFYPGFANYERGLPHRRSAEFRFHDARWATWFQMRHA
jgi:hypothetical protein